LKKIAFLAAVAAVFPGIAAAQPGVGPADPAAAAPPPAYRSIFDDLAKGVEEGQIDWRKANADVAQFPRGHADYVRWEEQQPGANPAASAAPASSAAPAAARPPAAPRPQGHQHH